MTLHSITMFTFASFILFIAGCSDNTLNVPEHIAKTQEENHISQTNRPTTVIEFFLPEQSIVTLTIFDVIRAEVARPVDHSQLDQGYSSVAFNASSLASGLYFYLLDAQGVQTHRLYSDGRKMLLIK